MQPGGILPARGRAVNTDVNQRARRPLRGWWPPAVDLVDEASGRQAVVPPVATG